MLVSSLVGGMNTLSISWITPFVAKMSVVITFDVLMYKTFSPPSTEIESESELSASAVSAMFMSDAASDNASAAGTLAGTM